MDDAASPEPRNGLCMRFPAGWRWSNRTPVLPWNGVLLKGLLSGSAEVTVDDRTEILAPGEAVVVEIERQSIAMHAHDGPIEIWWCHALAHASLRPGWYQARDRLLWASLCQRMAASLTDHDRAAARTWLAAIVLELVPRRTAAAAHPLAHVIAQIAADIGARPHLAWSTDDLGQRLGLRPTTAAVLFAKVHGIGLRELVQRCRIDQAKRLIEFGMPLLEVAQACGFSDQFQFSKRFHRYAGMPPSVWKVRQG